MSRVIVAPEVMTSAATELKSVGSALNVAHLMAAPPTLEVLPAAADEVSTGIAQLFSGYGEEYHKLAAEAAVYHEQFAQRLTASAQMYTSAEAVNVALLQPLCAIAQEVIAAAGLTGLLSQIGHDSLHAFYLTIESIEGLLFASGLGLAAVVGFFALLIGIAFFLGALYFLGLVLIQEFARFGISIADYFPLLQLVQQYP